jgi:hypothetical protein
LGEPARTSTSRVVGAWLEVLRAMLTEVDRGLSAPPLPDLRRSYCVGPAQMPSRSSITGAGAGFEHAAPLDGGGTRLPAATSTKNNPNPLHLASAFRGAVRTANRARRRAACRWPTARPLVRAETAGWPPPGGGTSLAPHRPGFPMRLLQSLAQTGPVVIDRA